jgi:hypothetical protein
MTHTPGPWTAEDCDGLYVRPADTSANIICDVVNRDGKGSRQTDEDWANAFMIAAAPDLYAALKRVVAVADRRTDVFDAARAAIAKAETGATP